MAEETPKPKRHFVLRQKAMPEPYKPRTGGSGGSKVPPQNRQIHGQGLKQQMNELKPVIAQARAAQEKAGMEEGFGLQIEFESFPDIELAFESLAAERSGIELLNVQHSENKTLATVLVPDGKLQIVKNKVIAYLDENRDTVNEEKGIRKPSNQKLVDAIRSIRVASVKSLWTDDWEVFPTDSNEAFWWEVWLPIRDDRQGTVDRFKALAQHLGFRVADEQIEFPERTVVMVHGSLGQMQESVIILNSIAELRRAKETADFFDSLALNEQHAWANELLQRSRFPLAGDQVPHVCLLDTGVNHDHPLLAPAIASRDTHTVEPSWGTNDNEGHGTEMAGLTLFGNLTSVFNSNEPITVYHRLESVKLLDRNHSNSENPEHHGYLTIQAVSRPEITAPERQRVFSMAVTARDARDRGRPSSWSATIDRLAVDYENQGETPRLFVIAAGNIEDNHAWSAYPDSISTDGIHDPAQAWNALTVGASTELTHITDPDTGGYQPVAPAGGLSPFTTSSDTWHSHWPLKPDIVFEGGNAARDAHWTTEGLHSLRLLTTSADISDRLLTTTNATSAATSLAARMAAQLMAEYPELRLETIRGLIVHSADWTQAMRDQYLSDPHNPAKEDVARMVRHCGFGVPDLSQALWSVENSLTLISEDRLRPFMREGAKDPKLRDMNLHRLPWPLAELEALGDIEVALRVTLSYFIEPNPSARGIKSRYRYESHSLRFEVKRPHETEDEFRQRINALSRDTEEGTQTSSGKDSNWLLGTRNRHRGSLHSDIWKGTAVDLASRGVLAVFPVSGWWKTRPKLKRYGQWADYSLLVSIRAPEQEVALYTAIKNQIAIEIEV